MINNIKKILRKYIFTIWFIRFIIDCLFIVFYAFILDKLIIKGDLIEKHKGCIPGYTKDSEGNFICGSEINQQINNPNIKLSVTAEESFIISVFPFILLILFNIIYFNIYKIKQSIIIWLLNIIRLIATGSSVTTIIVHFLKFTIGLPRPNSYSLKDDDGIIGGSAYESFPSGHIAIAYVNCYMFGIMVQKSLEYSIKKYHVYLKNGNNSNNVEIVIHNGNEGEENNNIIGDKLFFLPLWNLLKHIPTLSYFIVWSPMIGATYVGITRIREYWHSDVDCLAGALIGIFVGHITYKRYYNDFYLFD